MPTRAQVIEDNYFHDPDRTALDDASINGMVSDLRKRYDDKFSHYFNADQLKIFEEQTSGRFAGVGLSVTEVPQGLRVTAVFPDTPAKEAGIKAGDVITGVDGKSIAGRLLGGLNLPHPGPDRHQRRSHGQARRWRQAAAR